jgi:acetyltransferase-like isoleucine patch superfamily enzyme
MKWFDKIRNLDGRAHYRSWRAGIRNIYFYKKTHLELHPAARISVRENGRLTFNRSWTKAAVFPGILALGKDARVEVLGHFAIFAGAKIYVNKNATLVLGSGYINERLNLSCYCRIEIGEDVAIAENVCIRDSDNHAVTGSDGHTPKQPVVIGNHVWIGMNATILKGVTIGDGAIIAAGAVVTRDIPPACMAAGVPARILKRNVSWT